MEKLTSSSANMYIIRAVIAILTGILLVSLPDLALIYVVYLVGFFTIAMGVVSLFTAIDHRKKGAENSSYLFFAGAFINILLGIVLIFNPTFFINFLMIVIGLLLILIALLQLYSMYRSMKYGKIPFGMFILPIAVLVAGLLVVFNPFATLSTIVVIMGITLLFYGVSDLVIQYRIRQNLKKE